MKSTPDFLEISCIGEYKPVVLNFAESLTKKTAEFGPDKIVEQGNTKGGSTTVPLTSCLTGLESAV
jgi:hypothetical protein